MDRHIIDNLKMPEYTGTATNCAVPANAGTAGNTHATRDGGVIADRYVMSNMDQIINLHPITDDGIVESAAIDGRIRADLHVVADHDNANLLQLDPLVAVRGKTETIRTNDSARVNDGSPTDTRTVHDHAMGVEVTVITHFRIGANEDTVTDMNARTNPACRADTGPGTDPRRTVDHCGRMHDRAVLDTRGKAAASVDQGTDAGKGGMRIGHPHEAMVAIDQAGRQGEVPTYQNDAGPGLTDQVQMTPRQGEGNIGGTGPIQRGDTICAATGVADDIAFEELGQLRCGEAGFSGVAAWRQ